MSHSKLIQHAAFPDGGFVLHRVPVASAVGLFSAWYDAAGKLLDAERPSPHSPDGRRHSVRVNGPTWQALQEFGRAFVPAEIVQAVASAGL